MSSVDDWPPDDFEIGDEENDSLEEMIAALEALAHGNTGGTEKTPEFLYDVSDRYPEDADVLRVELRRTKKAGTNEIESKFLIGFMERNTFPEEGKRFQFYYHNYDGTLNFGYVHTKQPVEDVSNSGDFFYFTSMDGHWRLEIVNDSN